MQLNVSYLEGIDWSSAPVFTSHVLLLYKEDNSYCTGLALGSSVIISKTFNIVTGQVFNIHFFSDIFYVYFYIIEIVLHIQFCLITEIKVQSHILSELKTSLYCSTRSVNRVWFPLSLQYFSIFLLSFVIIMCCHIFDLAIFQGYPCLCGGVFLICNFIHFWNDFGQFQYQHFSGCTNHVERCFLCLYF